MKDIKKLMITLVALLAVTTGAWADETLLLTIESKDYTTFTSGSKTFDDMVTVTFSNEVYNDGNNWGWFSAIESSLLTVAGINGYTITSCKFYTYEGTAANGYTIEGESPSVYLEEGYVYTDNSKSEFIGNSGVTKIEVYGTAPSASSASGPEVAWDKAEKTGTFKMPGGNVTLEPEYYPQAELATGGAPTAINDVPATTDGAIVKAGTVKNIGETTTAQGTVMYYVSPTALDDAALLALAADQWTADVPTAESLAAGPAYVYYYVRGNDSDTDDETFSDGDILAANALTVTIAAAPTYAVTFADDLAEPTLWTASPNAGVTKGQTVTVTYSGTKKVLGVKAEKKAAAKPVTLAEATVGMVVGSDGNAYAVADKDNLPTGVTAAGMVAYKNGSNGLVIALTDEASTMDWDTANGATTGAAAHTPAVTGQAWKLPSQAEWQQMFSANGGNEGSSTGLNTALTNAGGTTLKSNCWSSTETGYANANYGWFSGGGAGFYEVGKANPNYVRACLAF